MSYYVYVEKEWHKQQRLSQHINPNYQPPDTSETTIPSASPSPNTTASQTLEPTYWQMVKNVSSNGVSHSWKWFLIEESITAGVALILGKTKDKDSVVKTVVSVVMAFISAITSGYSFWKAACEEAEKANMSSSKNRIWTTVSAVASGLLSGIITYANFWGFSYLFKKPANVQTVALI
ncbi:MAG: hypothetical protein LBB06_02940, partial [Endomicrobium sp.]|nr:hypothetical protein [Endomicrobium sp.]